MYLDASATGTPLPRQAASLGCLLRKTAVAQIANPDEPSPPIFYSWMFACFSLLAQELSLVMHRNTITSTSPKHLLRITSCQIKSLSSSRACLGRPLIYSCMGALDSVIVTLALGDVHSLLIRSLVGARPGTASTMPLHDPLIRLGRWTRWNGNGTPLNNNR